MSSYRLHFLNGRVYVVNQEGHGVADFRTADEARRYIREVVERQAVLTEAMRGWRR